MATLDSLELDIKALTGLVTDLRVDMAKRIAILEVLVHLSPCEATKDLDTRVIKLEATGNKQSGALSLAKLVWVALIAIFGATISAFVLNAILN